MKFLAWIKRQFLRDGEIIRYWPSVRRTREEIMFYDKLSDEYAIPRSCDSTDATIIKEAFLAGLDYRETYIIDLKNERDSWKKIAQERS